MSKGITIAYISRNTQKAKSVPKRGLSKKVYYLRDTINYELAGLSQLFNNEIVSENNYVK